MIGTQGDRAVIVEEPGIGLGPRVTGWLVAAFVGIVLGALMSLIQVPYAVLRPGPVTNTLGNGPGG